MKVSWRQCFILPAVDKAPRNGERVKPFQIQPVQVHLVRFRGQLLPQREGPGLWRILDEIVTPDFPWDQHCVVRTSRARSLNRAMYSAGNSSKTQWSSSTIRASRKTVRSTRLGISSATFCITEPPKLWPTKITFSSLCS